MGAIFLFLGWCIHLSLVEGKTPRFRGDAESFMDAGFRTLRRRGGLQKDFTKIEVTARRFPCCVLSYFSLVFVMEQLTNPSYKSQLSRAIN